MGGEQRLCAVYFQCTICAVYLEFGVILTPVFENQERSLTPPTQQSNVEDTAGPGCAPVQVCERGHSQDEPVGRRAQQGCHVSCACWSRKTGCLALSTACSAVLPVFTSVHERTALLVSVTAAGRAYFECNHAG
jgi:hypothetical protein